MSKGKGKGKNGNSLDKGEGTGSWRYQGSGYQGACQYCGKVGHKRAECWKCWKDHHEQEEEEAIEQVECQTCWMVGQVDEVVPLPEASWSRPRKLVGPNLARWPKSGPPGLGFGAADGHGRTDVCCNPFMVLDEEKGCDINQVEEESVNEVVDVTIDSGAGRKVWPKGKKVPGKLMPLKKKVKLVAPTARRLMSTEKRRSSSRPIAGGDVR